MAKILRHLGWKEWVMISAALIFIIIQVWFDLTMPEYMGNILKLLTSKSPFEMDDVYYNGKYMVLCVLGSLVTMIFVGYIASVVGASYAQRLRSKLYNKVDSFSMAEINKFSTASLITRSTNDVTQVQILVMRDGDIVESGTHHELLKRKGFYSELYNSQFETA